MLLHCETEDGSAGRGAGLAAGWLRPETLETLIELNELCLALVAEQAVSRGAPASPLLRQVAELWQVLDPAARRRAAGCPYLLVDAGFADPVRWRQPGSLGVGDGADSPYTTFFTVPAATDPCAALIAHLGLRQIQALAEAHPEWLRPRWPTRVRVWRELLLAAAAGEAPALERARLHGLTLLAAEARGSLPARADPGRGTG